jgi:alpha-methylacyl-CoA racemase
MSGPLVGTTIVEVSGRGPGPFAAMLLADMGAEVIRVDRIGRSQSSRRKRPDVLGRGKRSIAVDLKHPGGQELVLRLAAQADGLIEAFRPGVMERLGLGPAECLTRNPALIYARMTGWGQTGPYASAPGHDVNYIALAGCLAHFGPPDRPPAPPLSLVGDFGGGGLLLAFGIVCGLLEARLSGIGQVIDCAMVDGAAMLMAAYYAELAAGAMTERRGSNVLDGGAPFYNTYECADGKYIAIGAIEKEFYRELLEALGVAGTAEFVAGADPANWPEARAAFTALFRTRSQTEWCTILEGKQLCFAPVLPMSEAYTHPHNVYRGTFINRGGLMQPAPAPRFSRTAASVDREPPRRGQDADDILSGWLGLSRPEIDALRAVCAVQ